MADQADVHPRVLGGRVGEVAQQVLDLFGLVALLVERQQGPLDPIVFGEAFDHVAQLRLDARVVLQGVQHLEPVPGKLQIVGFGRDDLVERGQRLGIGPVAQMPVDLDLAQHPVVGLLGAERDHPVKRGVHGGAVLGLLGLAIGGNRRDRLHPRILGGGFDGAGAVAVEIGPELVLLGLQHVGPRLGARGLLEADLGQGDQPLDIVGVEFHQPQVLAIGFAGLALFADQPGIFAARAAMGPVEIEHVAELDQGAVDIALGQQGQPALVMAFRAALGIFAGRQRRGQQQGGDEP